MARAQELEQSGKSIVHMEVGEPDFSTAAPIVEAGIEALKRGETHYTSAPGIGGLRELIGSFYEQRYGVAISPGRIFITPGASAGLNLLANLLLNPQDGVLIPDPSYPCVRNLVHLSGAESQLVPVGIADNFQPSVAQLEQRCNDATSGLWVASPANPSGTVLSRENLRELSAWCRRNRYHFLVDEIYHGLHYVDDLPSALEIDDSSFVVNSFSKYFGMTGWRLGWIVVPEDFVEKTNILAQNLYISAPTVAQFAAMRAFDKDTVEILEQRREAFRLRRDFLSTELRLLGFEQANEVQGAFYVYADISAHSDNSIDFCLRTLEQHGVAITPGADFGVYQNERFVRFAFTTDMDSLEQGVERLSRAIR